MKLLKGYFSETEYRYENHENDLTGVPYNNLSSNF